MANSDRPKGFEPKGYPLRINRYVAGDTIQPGDAVHMEDDGKVNVAAAAEAVLGVAISGGTDGNEVLVSDDPNQLYVVQADGTDIDAQTDINLNYDLLATAGNTAFGISRHELDSSSGNTTATLQLKLVSIDERPDNALGAQVDCIVRMNNQNYAGGTGTVGI